MGCLVSKSGTRYEESQFMGTTIVAEKLKDKIMVGVDSRGSNENDQGLPDWKLSIHDDVYKFRQLSPNVMAVMAGRYQDCSAMCKSVAKVIASRRNNTVEYAYNEVLAHLEDLRGQKKNFGVIVVGWDTIEGYQIYRAFLKDTNIETERNVDIAAQGSGKKKAKKFAEKKYKYDMSDEEAHESLFGAVFKASLSDKYTGGILRVYSLRKHDYLNEIIWEEAGSKDAMEAYSDYYDLSKEQKTLFVLYSNFDHPLTANDLIAKFGNYGAVADSCLCQLVAQCLIEGQCYYFYRLVFKEPRHAAQVLRNVEMERMQVDGHLPEGLRYMTPIEMKIAEENPADTVYVVQSSRGLLRHIRSNSTVQNWDMPR